MHANSLNALLLSEELDDFQLYEQIYEQVIERNESNRELFKQSVCPNYGNQSVSICVQRIQTGMKQYTSEFLLVSLLLFEIVKQFPVTGGEAETMLAESLLGHVNSFSDLFVRIWNWTTDEKKRSSSSVSFCENEEYMHLRKLLHLTSSSTLSGMISSMMTLIQKKAMENEASYDAEFLNDLFTFHNDILEVMRNKLSLVQQNLSNAFLLYSDFIA